MKLIIAGSRTISKPPERIIRDMLDLKLPYEDVTEVVSGCARGMDKAGEAWAKLMQRPIKLFPAEWARYGRAAGVIRNKQMAEYADWLFLVWNGNSSGAASMKRLMEERGKPVWEVLECEPTVD